jgi:uncharacterized protein (DUF2141 family)
MTRSLWFALAVAAPLLASADPPPTAQVRAEISGIRNSRGDVGCLLFASSDGWPQTTARAYRVRHAAIADGRATCDFGDLPAGQYAVMTIHDENRNGICDKNAFGAPKEGYGASNNVTHTFSPPTFDEARFTVANGAVVVTRITLKY